MSVIRVTHENAYGWGDNSVVTLPTLRMECSVCGAVDKFHTNAQTRIDQFINTHGECEKEQGK